MLRSMVCRYEHFTQPWYARWLARFQGTGAPHVPPGPLAYHRKGWEWAAILQALDERGFLCHGKRGLGFAVGGEPLASIMASSGAQIVATDLPQEQSDERWTQTGQHAASREALFRPDNVDRSAFERLVSFQPVDMTALDQLEGGPFDFLWSSCAFEHLGDLGAGLEFVTNAMRLLKPGGVAAHTTEFNVSSDDETWAVGPNCVYRRRDIEALDRRLRTIRCGLESADFDAGTHPYDLDYDIAPYGQTGRAHIKLDIGGHVCTSFLVIIRKGG